MVRKKCDLLYHDYWPEQDPIIPKGTPFISSDSASARKKATSGAWFRIKRY
jgi:hypothetical protein